MKPTLLTLFTVLFLSCAEDPNTVWCTGEGTGALVRDDSKYFKEAWKTTNHPLCEGELRGSVVSMDQMPVDLTLKWDYASYDTTVTVHDGFFDEFPPGEHFLASDGTIWSAEADGWLQKTTKQKDRVWVMSKSHRHDTAFPGLVFDPPLLPSAYFLVSADDEDYVELDNGRPFVKFRIGTKIYRVYLEQVGLGVLK